MATGRESAVTSLITLVKNNVGDMTGGKISQAALVDAICAEVVRAKPHKPVVFIDCITDFVLKVNYSLIYLF